MGNVTISHSRYRHTKLRMKERFDMDIDESDYMKLCEISKESYVIKPYSTNRDFRVLRYKGRVMTIGFNNKYGLVNTVLYTYKKDMRDYKKFIKKK